MVGYGFVRMHVCNSLAKCQGEAYSLMALGMVKSSLYSRFESSLSFILIFSSLCLFPNAESKELISQELITKEELYNCDCNR
ncbi:hypothetical protein K1719_022914 [Acacia pycnantha]|nr:hypothetical protein K1719_022914 [Acacia pycnantha]